ncbi:unnamed protein product [Aphanomyces euteiches]
MLDGMYAAVRCDRQDWILHEEGQLVVKIIMDAIKPPSFQRAVISQMILTRNKPLKKDAFRFVRWLREFAIFHERYVGDGEQIYKPAQPKKHMNIRGAVAAKAAVAPATPVAVPVDHNAPGRACLKCQEASGLLRAHAQANAHRRAETNGRREQNPRGRQGGRVATIRVAQEPTPQMATIGGVLPVAVLFDSGADVSVASGGLLAALLAAGEMPKVIEMGSLSIQPYGVESKPIKVTKQVILPNIEFETDLGRLMLRDVRVWLDEASEAIELTLGLPVMKRLGYDDRVLLENAWRQH